MSVSKRKMPDGTFVWQYDVYYEDPITGERKRQRASNKTWNKKKAQEAENLFLVSINQAESITYSELVQVCYKYKAMQLKESSMRKYNDIQKSFILPTFGNVKIERITNKMIVKWQEQLLSATYEDRNGVVRPYSNNVITDAQTALMSVLKWAVESEYLPSNPFRSSQVKHQEFKEELEVWDEKTFNRFMDVVRTEDESKQYIALFELLYYGGLRIGEAQALNVGDYDGHGVKINKTWNKDIQKPTPPKTKNSYRYVELDPDTCESINQMIATYPQIPEFKKMPLFGFFKRMSVTTMNRKRTEWNAKAGVPYLKTHGFRHSHVTYLLQLPTPDGNPITAKMVAKRIGDTEEMVLKRYSHLFQDSQQNIINMIAHRRSLM